MIRPFVAFFALLLLAQRCAGAPPADYRAIISRPESARLTQSYRELAALGNRSSGSTATLDWAEARLRDTGLTTRREAFPITIPDPNARATLTFGSKSLDLVPLWPNLVRTSTCDVTGELVDGGDGSLEALRGRPIKGSIVIVDFDSEDRWTEIAALGAKAIIFRRPPEGMRRAEAEAKFKSTPLDVPRFLLEGPAPTGVIAHLVCRQSWVTRTSANLIADLPGDDARLRDEPIVLWAYADAMSIAPGMAPGAEQAGGLVALLELVRTLQQDRHRRPVRIVVSGAHCLDLQGAKEYIDRRFGEHPPLLVVTLDLSTASKALGVFGRGYAYNYRDEILDSILSLCRMLRKHAEKLAPMLGETIPRVVLTDAAGHSDNRTWRNNIPAKFALDCEPFMSAGYNAITFATIDDAREHVDTPDDTFDRIDVGNLLRQVQVLAVMLHHLVDDPVAQAGGDVLPLHPASPSRISHLGGFATADGYVAVYDPTKSLVPDLRVPNSLVVRIVGNRTLMGVRGCDIQKTLGPAATYRLIGLPPLTDYATLVKPDTVIVAYHLDPSSGRIDYAPDQGAFGAAAFPIVSELKTSSRTSPIVLFPCATTNLFGLIDPQDFSALGNPTILDPNGGGAPRSFGFAQSAYDETSRDQADGTAVIFMPPGTRFQLLMGSDTGDSRLILTGSSTTNVAGKGYAVDGENFGDVALPTVRDIHAIDADRIHGFKRYRIVGSDVDRTHLEIGQTLSQAEIDQTARDWPGAKRRGRAAWALALRNHPVLQATASDVIEGVLFYSFLLIPFSFFIERLVFASRSVARQVLLTAGIFGVAFVTLRAVHPGFNLVSNPPMIFVGFVMGALSLIVATFILGKFESGMREIKQTSSGVREIDVKRSNVAMAAFSLGISNLHRRRARTLLTTLTLVVMTFIVLSFTSIVPELQLRQNPTSNEARYPGILLRNPALDPLPPAAYDALANEFMDTPAVPGGPASTASNAVTHESAAHRRDAGATYGPLVEEGGRSAVPGGSSAGRATVVRRVYSYGPDVLPGASMSVQKGNLWADASVVEGLDPGEANLTRPQEALRSGRWFRAGERDTIILPEGMAKALKAGIGDTVRFMAESFRLIGIFDPERMKRVVDLDGESIVPPDFSQSKQKQTQSRTQTNAFRKYIRLDPAMVILMPAQAALDLGGEIRAIGVGFARGSDAADAMASLMPRVRLNLCAAVPFGRGLEVRQFSEVEGAKATGLGLILVQIAIAAIFVFNTMIASVFERTKEISIFSAIGLAPNHIATLFFAESLVLGVLGVVFGYFAAQGAAKVIVETGAFPQLALNFSSTGAIFAALLVLLVVILSTIYPARMAAKIAAPAMADPRLPEPEGDRWVIPLPFTIASSDAEAVMAFLTDWLRSYEQYAIGSFVTADTVQIGLKTMATVWLAPYDLGVSQRVEIAATAGVAADVTELTLTAERIAGEPKNWARLNPRFLTAVRRQFLAWRASAPEMSTP